MDCVHIVWRDAMGVGGDGWSVRDGMEEQLAGDTLIEDVGFVLFEDDTKIVIAGGHSMEEEDSLLAPICHRILLIPTGCIVKKKRIKL